MSLVINTDVSVNVATVLGSAATVRTLKARILLACVQKVLSEASLHFEIAIAFRTTVIWFDNLEHL